MIGAAENLVLVTTVVVGLAAAAAAQDQQDQQGEQSGRPSGARGVFTGAADDVLGQLNYISFDRDSVIDWDPLRGGMRELNDSLERAARIRIGFAWTALYQHASESKDEQDAAVADFDFFGRWRPLQTRDMLGYVVFQTEARYLLGADIPPSDLGAEIGSLWGTVNAFNLKSFELKQLYWQHFLFDNTFTYRVGKIDQSVTFNNNRLQSDNVFFLNAAFSSNPTLPFPNNGLGLDFTWRPGDWGYVAWGAANADPDDIDLQPDKKLRAASWSTIAEIGFTPWFDGLGGGHYRFTLWYTDSVPEAEQPDSHGFAVSIDQDLGPGIIGFLRYGYGDGNLTDTDQILAGGVGVKRPMGVWDDFAGLALAYGEPSDSTLRNQWAAEAFYRFQLTPSVQVTPDIQLIIEPTNSPLDYVWVAGIRVRATF